MLGTNKVVVVGYHRKFRTSLPEVDESPEQFISATGQIPATVARALRY